MSGNVVPRRTRGEPETMEVKAWGRRQGGPLAQVLVAKFADHLPLCRQS